MKPIQRLFQCLLLIAALSSHVHAFYASDQGRWLNRDPVEEQGGMNLYGIVDNNPINFVDLHGLCSITIDVAHGGTEISESTKRAKHRLEGSEMTLCDKFISVGCGANYLNDAYRQGGLGLPEMPPFQYPTNNDTNEHDSPLLEKNGRSKIDICPATKLTERMDEAVITAKAYALTMGKTPCCCKKVTIHVECTESDHDPKGLENLEKARQRTTGRLPICGSVIVIELE
ncbi:MAG: hypothetical protein RLZZ505_3007 [Verrucomicrobiota bacterium]|jgi:hypothetical protein